MSDNSDRPDWLDELYQEDNSDLPPENLNASIRAAARDAVGLRPWYKQTRTLASVATLALALGITTLWIGAPGERTAVVVEPVPASLPAREMPAERTVFVSDAQLPEEAVAFSDEPASSAEVSANRTQGLQKSAARVSIQHSAEASKRALETGSPAQLEQRSEDPDPADCTTLTLIDIGEPPPYAVCHQDETALVNHPGCSQPYPVPAKELQAQREAGSLIVVIDGQRQQLRCDPATDTWIIAPFAAEN